MIQDDAIYVVGAGAQTSVGRYVLAAAAAVRCGISAYSEHPFMINRHGEPMIVAMAKWLDEDMAIAGRVRSLALDAAREALQPLDHCLPALRGALRVHLALSSENLTTHFLRREVADSLAADGMLPAGVVTEVIAAGHAGGLLALANACHQLRRGEAKLCLVGGADSYMDPERLEALDGADQMHSQHQTWGFIPGEGAGFCLLATGASARSFGLTPLAELLSVGTAQEPNTMGMQSICIGEGLTEAFRVTLDSRYQVNHSYCDLNGEVYRANEYGFAICRTAEFFEDAGSFSSPAECWGDVGAASGPLTLTLALAAWSRRYAKGPVTLVWSSSAQAPLRAAALLKQWGG